jgi:hypothetical protein
MRTIILAFVVFWIAVVGVFVLRTVWFLITLLWAGARQLRDDVRTGGDEPGSPER